MLMRNSDYQFAHANTVKLCTDELLNDCEPREMLLGHFGLTVLFIIAILLQAMT